MSASRLIFVDGIIGAGKSRLAQRLWLHLHRCGSASEWFAEPQSGHPLHELGDISGLDARGAAALALEAWRDFVRERQRTAWGVTLLDATLLQATVRFLEAFAVPRIYWRQALTRLVEVTRPLEPALIYLHPGEPYDALERIAAIRGAEWRGYMEGMFADGGFPALQAYYARRLDQDLSLIRGVGLRSLVLSPADGSWEDRYAAACAFLGIEDPEPADGYVGDMSQLAGWYREPVSGVSWELGLRDGRLGFATGDQPRLLHVEGAGFVVEGRPIEAVFTFDASGRAPSLRFSGPLADDPLPGTVWHRVEP